MRTRKRFIFLAVSLLSAALLLLLVPAREPQYQNQPLSYWTGLYFTAPRIRAAPAQQELANQAIRHIGTNAIPYLLNWLKYDPYRLDPLYNRLPNNVRNNQWLYRIVHGDLKEGRSDAAVLALIALGPQVRSAIPELVRLISSDDIHLAHSAAIVVTSLGPAAVPALTAAATDPRSPNRHHLVSTFEELGTNALLTLPTLTNLLQDPDPGIRTTAHHTLLRIVHAVSTDDLTPHSSP